jgi:hypothetical protein
MDTDSVEGVLGWVYEYIVEKMVIMGVQQSKINYYDQLHEGANKKAIVLIVQVYHEPNHMILS